MGALGDQSFSYDLDDNGQFHRRLSNCGPRRFSGCPQLTITCGGYGNVALMVNTPVDEFALLNVTGGDPDQYSEITAVLDCMEYGWAGSEPDFAFRDNVITCGGQLPPKGEGTGTQALLETGTYSISRAVHVSRLSKRALPVLGRFSPSSDLSRIR